MVQPVPDDVDETHEPLRLSSSSTAPREQPRPERGHVDRVDLIVGKVCATAIERSRANRRRVPLQL